ncbi:hypothetical protein PRIC1_002560 [Phytophthora ramorum]|uniref:uncharacterized protein n=1 Tax=Phytophthora ramorum TaxID=164328 RepID=UPI0030B348DC|nr:hypothetical protein KRP23_883 [Phytophthora ramorum]
MRQGRTKIRSEGGFVASRHVYESLSNGRKLEIALFARIEGATSAADKYWPLVAPDVRESKRKLMYEWIAQIPKLEKVCQSHRGRNSKRSRKVGSATTLSRDAERIIVQWVSSLREDGVPVSLLMLRVKALDVALSTLDKLDLLDKRHGVIRDSDDFVGSELAVADLADLEFEEDRDAQFL